MSDQHPPKWFDRQERREEEDQESEARKARLLEEMPRLMDRRKRGRADSFLPYLLIRSVLGDRGDRPINVPFWESPDIWTAPGAPEDSPAIPPDHGGVVNAGQPTTLYAHVWNLGFAPLAGVRVEYYWFDPSLSIDSANANLIGIAECQLSGRGMDGSHKLVKCPSAWVPVMTNGGHECLLVRVSGIGDPIGGNPWQPWANRHIAQRNISVVAVGQNLAGLITSLNRTRTAGARVQLLQIGAREGELARFIAAPKLRISALQTQPIADLDAEQHVRMPRLTKVAAAMLAPVHALARGGAPKPPPLRRAAASALLDLTALIGAREAKAGTSKLKPGGPVRPAGAAARPAAAAALPHLTSLIERALDLYPGVKRAKPPGRGEAHVVRVASYRGDQLIGGYTLLVTGKKR